jgi:hypothetical protein
MGTAFFTISAAFALGLFAQIGLSAHLIAKENSAQRTGRVSDVRNGSTMSKKGFLASERRKALQEQATIGT